MSLFTSCQSKTSSKITITINPVSGAFPNKKIGETVELKGKKKMAINEFDGYPGEPIAAGRYFLYYIDENNKQYSPNDAITTTSKVVTLTAQYSECHHTDFTDFTVNDNQLYGICPLCHENVLIPDGDLFKYNNKFLLKVNNQYEMHNITNMKDIVNSAPKDSTLNMYFINGEYQLSGSRASESPVTCNVHGLYKNDGETYNASIKCSESLGVQTFSGVYFNFEHLIMNGEHRKDAGWYYGLRTPSIVCNHCVFNGKQTIYTDYTIFNDCFFDSTNFEDEPDYAIYVYGNYYVEFNRCDFESDGKALKIYSEKQNEDIFVNLTDCNFKIREQIEDKAAIQVDSQELLTTETYMFITITHCTQTGYIGGLCLDSVKEPNRSEIKIID